MKDDLDKEQKADQEAYESMDCWCKTNDKKKTQAIAAADKHLADLESLIDQLTQTSEELNGEIDGLKGEMAKNQKALDTATALRTKQLAEFNQEEKEMLASIQSLGAALASLNKHHGASSASAALTTVKNMIGQNQSPIKKQVEQKKVLLQGVAPHQRNIVAALLQGSQDAAPHKAQSGEIFGILKQMKENFETSLAQSQAEEKQNKQQYEDLRAAKEEEIDAGKASLKERKQHLADTDQKNALAKEDQEDTQESFDADTQFLKDLKVKCSETDEEWNKRQLTRQGEMKAISQAIEVLSGDDARDTFSRTFSKDASFFQVSKKAVRQHAASTLLTAAAKMHSSQFVALAGQVREEPIEKVEHSIEDMAQIELPDQKEDEVKTRDSCIKDLNQNELDTEETEHTRQTLESKISGSEMTIKELNTAITSLKGEIADLQIQLRRAQEDREMENKEFAQTVADQKDTQAMLQKARDVLKKYYQPKFAEKGAVLVQKDKKTLTEQPEGFKEYKKNDSSTGIIMLIESIISDAKMLQQEAEHDEKTAVELYEKFKTKTGDAIKAKKEGITNKTADKAEAEQDLSTAKEQHRDTMATLEGLSNAKGALHERCDYILKNFDVRQAALDDEIKALKDSYAYLHGAENLH
eukprot:gnl/TRDRNA2_/TRDRNA2_126395_c0_seq2.p1 gnl/TRDRNA2_/TRDRNA2_126395_c0~~gnl/TRDRNA2_/TRDRNA2_126395_c0_seq2.p1  ORF type:complete len:674 (+),score=217.08 gnl/TRDRNA2_/TRDRNA2_126395_c0_seq2:103-2022(+)